MHSNGFKKFYSTQFNLKTTNFIIQPAQLGIDVFVYILNAVFSSLELFTVWNMFKYLSRFFWKERMTDVWKIGWLFTILPIFLRKWKLYSFYFLRSSSRDYSLNVSLLLIRNKDQLTFPISLQYICTCMPHLSNNTTMYILYIYEYI